MSTVEDEAPAVLARPDEPPPKDVGSGHPRVALAALPGGDLPRDHGAVFGAADARRVGLPVIEADPRHEQWRQIWRLRAKYFALGPSRVYEGRLASQIWPLDFST